MAKIGLRYPVYAVLTDSASPTYSGGAVFSKAIQADVAVESNNVELYADDGIAETDYSFKKGSISFTGSDITDAVKVAVFGYTEGAEADAVTGAKELIATGAAPAAIGFGFYCPRKVSGITYYRAIWLKKVEFAEPGDANKTKGESVEFGTAAVTGTIRKAGDGNWKEEVTSFETEAKAIAWLNGKAGISSAASNNLSDLVVANGTLTPTFSATKYLYSCDCTNNITITATFAAGTAKVYVDGVYTETLVTTVTGATITMASGNNKLIKIVVQESGKSAVTYTIVAQRA